MNQFENYFCTFDDKFASDEEFVWHNKKHVYV